MSAHVFSYRGDCKASSVLQIGSALVDEKPEKAHRYSTRSNVLELGSLD